MIRAVMAAALISAAWSSNSFGAIQERPAFESAISTLERADRYIIREGAEIRDDPDGPVHDLGHIGGSVETIPVLSDETWTVIVTCDGIGYMQTEDLAELDPALPKLRSLGVMKITHYCACSRCGSGTGITASGKKATTNHTIAVSQKTAPIGSHMIINGVEYVVEDRGVPAGVVDIFVSDHQLAKRLGTYKAEVYVVEQDS